MDNQLIEINDNLEIIGIVIGLAKNDTVKILELSKIVKDSSLSYIQKIPFNKLAKYMDGIKRVEENIGDGCRLSDKLFGDQKSKNDNALRLLKYVTEADTEKKIEYLVNTTRSFLLGRINVGEMFRVFNAIVYTLPEDLHYLTTIIEKEGPFIGNIQIHALNRNGLVISAGVYADYDIEKQKYHISELGYMVDQNSLSMDNDDRQRWYSARRSKSIPFEGPEEHEGLTQEQMENLKNKI